MKKIFPLAFIFLIALFDSCDEKKNSIPVDTTAVEANLLKESLFDPGKYQTVVVKKDTDNLAWLKEPVPGTDPAITNAELKYTESDGYYFIDLKQIGDDTTNAIKAKWLYKNGGRIDHEKTAMYVENTHKFQHPEMLRAMYEKKDESYTHIVTVDQLEKSIGSIYTNDKYDKYIEFVTGPILTLVVSDYSDKGHKFSIPMIKSVIKSNCLGAESKLAIDNVTDTESGETFTYLKVIGRDAFYNYSNEPR